MAATGGLWSMSGLNEVIKLKNSSFKPIYLCLSVEEIISRLPSESPSCIICHQNFFNRSSLRRHMERHLLVNRKRFQCDICFKLFCRKDYVREHKQHKHGSKS